MPQPESDQLADAPVDDTVAAAAEPVAEDDHLVEDLLVEEVSIDGMCGVY